MHQAINRLFLCYQIMWNIPLPTNKNAKGKHWGSHLGDSGLTWPQQKTPPGHKEENMVGTAGRSKLCNQIDSLSSQTWANHVRAGMVALPPWLSEWLRSCFSIESTVKTKLNMEILLWLSCLNGDTTREASIPECPTAKRRCNNDHKYDNLSGRTSRRGLIKFLRIIRDFAYFTAVNTCSTERTNIPAIPWGVTKQVGDAMREGWSITVLFK